MSLQNAIEIAEANLRDAKLDWEDFCREKDELEEPVDENDTEVTVQHSIMEALIVAAKAEAARQEGARGGEPAAWRVDFQDESACLVFTRDDADEVIADALPGATASPLYASPAEPSGWRPIEGAPKDGTTIMGWRAGWGPCECRWEVDFDGDECSFAGWVDPNADDETRPTHWMPLPLPPTSEGGGA